jgi:hypothetical protein
LKGFTREPSFRAFPRDDDFASLARRKCDRDEDAAVAGSNRILWVKVDTRTSDLDLKAQIGHELRHTIEVLSDRTVTSQVAMYFFYSQMGPVRSGSRFETHAAITTGEVVRLEVAAVNRKRAPDSTPAGR